MSWSSSNLFCKSIIPHLIYVCMYIHMHMYVYNQFLLVCACLSALPPCALAKLVLCSLLLYNASHLTPQQTVSTAAQRPYVCTTVHITTYIHTYIYEFKLLCLLLFWLTFIYSFCIQQCCCFISFICALSERCALQNTIKKMGEFNHFGPLRRCRNSASAGK